MWNRMILVVAVLEPLSYQRVHIIHIHCSVNNAIDIEAIIVNYVYIIEGLRETQCSNIAL
jgi:hypothetical protein